MKEKEMLENKINLLKEDLECVHTYLDDKQVSRKDDKGKVYSIVGRIKRLEENLSHRDYTLRDKELLLNFFNAGNECGCMEHENIKDYFEQYYNKTFKSE